MVDNLNIPIKYKFTTFDDGLILICSISAVTNTIPTDDIEAYHVGHSMERALQLACADRIVAHVYDKGVKLQRNDSGAPFLIGVDDYVSISHTGDYMAIYFSNAGPIAVDIEILGRDISAIQNRFTSEEEIAPFKLLDFTEPLLQIWSIKECLFKVIPVDKVLFKEHLNIASISQNQAGTSCSAEVIHPQLHHIYSVESRIFEPLIVSYTTRTSA